MDDVPDDRRIRVGTTTEALVDNARDAPAIVSRYWLPSLAGGLIVGTFAWWITDDAIGGVTGLILVFVGGLLLGWGVVPFLPRSRQVIRSGRR